MNFWAGFVSFTHLDETSKAISGKSTGDALSFNRAPLSYGFGNGSSTLDVQGLRRCYFHTVIPCTLIKITCCMMGRFVCDGGRSGTEFGVRSSEWTGLLLIIEHDSLVVLFYYSKIFRSMQMRADMLISYSSSSPCNHESNQMRVIVTSPSDRPSSPKFCTAATRPRLPTSRYELYLCTNARDSNDI